MINIFIDSNIWLSLYHFTNDDIKQFSQLETSIDSAVRLIVTEQVYYEVQRNREGKLASALKDFTMPALKYPTFCRDYNEFKSFSESYTQLQEQYKSWRNKIDNDILKKRTPADIAIRSLFDKAGIVKVKESVLQKAKLRYDRGNPPGKNRSYGDAINWECLIEEADVGSDLYIISADKDFASPIDKNRISYCLAEEWSRKKKSNAFLYTSLVTFFEEHIKTIELETERDKDDLVNALGDSSSFVTTHALIAKMKTYDSWTDQQITGLCAAAVNNNQVGWIIDDDDIISFYKEVLSRIRMENGIDSAVRTVLEHIRQPETE